MTKKVGRPAGVRNEYNIRRDLEHSRKQEGKLVLRAEALRAELADIEARLTIHREKVTEYEQALATNNTCESLGVPIKQEEAA